MKLHELTPVEGSKKTRNRVGRGIGSGNGKTSGRGMKGQKSRSGGGTRTGFEGGQMPLYRRLPKRGFKNVWADVFAEVNVATLNRYFEDGDVVDLQALLGKKSDKKKCVFKSISRYDGLRILGEGELTKKLTVKANGFSKSAKEKIEAAGGTVEVLPVKKFVNPRFKKKQDEVI